MQAGQLKHIVTIQYYDTTQDTTGQPLKSWITLVGDYPANITPLAGRELYAASEKFAEATTRIQIRFLDGLTEQMRVIHDGPHCCGGKYVLFDVLNVLDSAEEHTELVMLCRSGLNQG